MHYILRTTHWHFWFSLLTFLESWVSQILWNPGEHWLNEDLSFEGSLFVNDIQYKIFSLLVLIFDRIENKQANILKDMQILCSSLICPEQLIFDSVIPWQRQGACVTPFKTLILKWMKLHSFVALGQSRGDHLHLGTCVRRMRTGWSSSLGSWT